MGLDFPQPVHAQVGEDVGFELSDIVFRGVVLLFLSGDGIG